MGVKTFESNGGYAKFGKEDNVYFKLKNIKPGWNDREDEPQLEGTAQAVPVEGGEPGTIPFYFSSKITLLEDDNYSSNTGKLLREVGKARAVLSDLDVSEEHIKEILDESENTRYEAETKQENSALFEAIVEHLKDLDAVWKGGTMYGGDGEYSKLTKVVEAVEKNPFADDPAEQTASDDDAESEAADAEDDGAALA